MEKPESESEHFNAKSSFAMKDYGFYSTVVFQMLATIGLAFWGGNWINEYYGFQNKLLTVAIGFLGLGLALFNTIRLLKYKEEQNKK